MPTTPHIRQLALLAGLALLVSGCAAPTQRPAASSVAGAHGPAASLSPARQQVVSQARRLLGTPYRYGGNDPRGFDCSGLVQYTHRSAGIAVPRITRDQQRRATPVSADRLRPGDLLFFNIEGKSRHVGIYIGRGEFIHAPSRGKRVSRARLDTPYWRHRLVSTGSYL